MKKILVAAALLAFTVPAAQAQCSKKALNGNWSVDVGPLAISGTATGGNFTFTSGGGTLTFTLNSFSSSKCKGTGTGNYFGIPVTVTAASEKIPGGSEKPNHLLVTISAGGDSLILVLQRL
jgi:hypothetical protein